MFVFVDFNISRGVGNKLARNGRISHSGELCLLPLPLIEGFEVGGGLRPCPRSSTSTHSDCLRTKREL